MPKTFLQTVQELTPTHWIAIAALAVSLTSLTVSALGYRRDRPKLKMKVRLYGSFDTPGYIEINAVNAGRRPIFLVRLWGRDPTGAAVGKRFDHEGPGRKLGENEHMVFRVTHLPRGQDEFDAAAMDDDGFYEFERMSIEDSLGKRHNIPKMKALLPALRADYKDWCERTGYWKPQAPPPAVPAADV